jgi:hypothetical protein
MITSLRPDLCVSEEGFSVEVLGRTGLRYREGENQMFVDFEVLAGPSGMLVSKSSMGPWAPPNAAEAIGDLDRARIVENIRETFRLQGFEIYGI